MEHFAPLETRAEPEDTSADPLVVATEAVTALQAGFTEFQTRADQRLAGIEALTQRIADLETRANRPAGGTPAEHSLERRAFTNYLRIGDQNQRMPVDEIRALIVGEDPRGGYLAPAEFQAEVIKGIIEISPIRQAVRVGSTGAGSVILPRLLGRPTATWTGEEEEHVETSMSFGQLEIPVHELTCYIDVSLRLLEDSAINVESEVATELSQEFAGKESLAFSNGTGSKQPLGLQRATITDVVNGHATVINPDKLVALMYALPQTYRANGSWLMNSTTLGVLRTLKDTTGAYLWQPGLQAGQPSTLLGRPVIEDPTMPDIASGTAPIIYGDFSRAYRVYDRVGLDVLRDPYTMAKKSLVRFHARRRVGGGPVLTEALRRLKMSVS